MKTRIISAAVGLVLLAAVICLFETAALDVAVVFLSVIAVHELIHAAGLSGKRFFEGVCLAFAALFATVYFNIFSSLTMLAEFVFAGIVMVFLLTDHKEISATSAAFAFFVATLVPRAFSLLLLYRQYGSPTSYFLVFMSLGTAWFNDSCAYFTGCAIGKHKLCPEISPKKTVEGAIGGIAGGSLLCIGLALIFSARFGITINWLSLGLYLPIGMVAGILGDLCASIIKRQFGIKDYGNIMPGHGGIMDRFDSWIFIAPLLYIWNIYAPFII